MHLRRTREVDQLRICRREVESERVAQRLHRHRCIHKNGKPRVVGHVCKVIGLGTVLPNSSYVDSSEKVFAEHLATTRLLKLHENGLEFGIKINTKKGTYRVRPTLAL
jgi:hypothetical protein